MEQETENLHLEAGNWEQVLLLSSVKAETQEWSLPDSFESLHSSSLQFTPLGFKEETGSAFSLPPHQTEAEGRRSCVKSGEETWQHCNSSLLRSQQSRDTIQSLQDKISEQVTSLGSSDFQTGNIKVEPHFSYISQPSGSYDLSQLGIKQESIESFEDCLGNNSPSELSLVNELTKNCVEHNQNISSDHSVRESSNVNEYKQVSNNVIQCCHYYAKQVERMNKKELKFVIHCVLCSKDIDAESYFLNHKKECLPDQVHKCSLCPQRILSHPLEYDGLCHIYKHLQASTKLIECKYCHNVFFNSYNYNTHAKCHPFYNVKSTAAVASSHKQIFLSPMVLKALSDIKMLCDSKIFSIRLENKTYMIHCSTCSLDILYDTYFNTHLFTCMQHKCFICGIETPNLQQNILSHLIHIKCHFLKPILSKQCKCKLVFINNYNCTVHVAENHFAELQPKSLDQIENCQSLIDPGFEIKKEPHSVEHEIRPLDMPLSNCDFTEEKIEITESQMEALPEIEEVTDFEETWSNGSQVIPPVPPQGSCTNSSERNVTNDDIKLSLADLHIIKDFESMCKKNVNCIKKTDTKFFIHCSSCDLDLPYDLFLNEHLKICLQNKCFVCGIPSPGFQLNLMKQSLHIRCHLFKPTVVKQCICKAVFINDYNCTLHMSISHFRKPNILKRRSSVKPHIFEHGAQSTDVVNHQTDSQSEGMLSDIQFDEKSYESDRGMFSYDDNQYSNNTEQQIDYSVAGNSKPGDDNLKLNDDELRFLLSLPEDCKKFIEEIKTVASKKISKRTRNDFVVHCISCFKDFPYGVYFNSHLEQCLAKDIKTFKCTLCGLNLKRIKKDPYKNLFHYLLHIDGHFEEAKFLAPSHICSKCDRVFPNTWNQVFHEVSIHPPQNPIIPNLQQTKMTQQPTAHKKQKR